MNHNSSTLLPAKMNSRRKRPYEEDDDAPDQISTCDETQMEGAQRRTSDCELPPSAKRRRLDPDNMEIGDRVSIKKQILIIAAISQMEEEDDEDNNTMTEQQAWTTILKMDEIMNELHDEYPGTAVITDVDDTTYPNNFIRLNGCGYVLISGVEAISAGGYELCAPIKPSSFQCVLNQFRREYIKKKTDEWILDPSTLRGGAQAHNHNQRNEELQDLADALWMSLQEDDDEAQELDVPEQETNQRYDPTSKHEMDEGDETDE